MPDLETLQLLGPELALTGIALLIFVLDLFLKRREDILGWLALAGMIATVLISLPLAIQSRTILSGMLAVDPLAVYFKIIAALTTALVLMASVDYLRTRSAYRGEFYGLMVLATLSMTLLAASTDLIMIFISLEFLSLTSYVLVGYLRHDWLSTEGGLKYLLYGAVTTAITLYGMSLVYGVTGSTSLEAIAQALADPANPMAQNQAILLPSLIFVLAGFAFKISLVPFHQWTPDAYEGAPIPVAAFLSVGPKAAGFAILLRTLLVAFPSLQVDWIAVLSGIAVVTMTFGNLVAIQQRNIKRLLAYSSISQAGYILLGVIAFWVGFGTPGVLIYVLAYLFTNLGAFIVVVAFSHLTGSDDIHDYAGLVRRAPFLALALVVFFMSLAGIPPTGGFLGKLYVFGAAIQAGFWPLAVAGVLNSVVSLYYYFGVVRQMFFLPPKPPLSLPVPRALLAAIVISLAGTLIMGIYPQPFIELATDSVAIVGQLP
ncbi:MAG: NADH-quinone oxidoreductase subunit N [Chloroflexi bacterium]|nr:NADH-quinone oxidoreductase subunit N [Chloroflexota bacterium]